MADDEYQRKLRDLQKFVPFLENTIKRLKSESDKPREAQVTKLQSLLEILTDPKKKLKYDALKKCEEVILKLYNKRKSGDNKMAGPLGASKIESPQYGAPWQRLSSLQESATPASPSPPLLTIPLLLPKPVVIPTEQVRAKPTSTFFAPNTIPLNLLVPRRDCYSNNWTPVDDGASSSNMWRPRPPQPVPPPNILQPPIQSNFGQPRPWYNSEPLYQRRSDIARPRQPNRFEVWTRPTAVDRYRMPNREIINYSESFEPSTEPDFRTRNISPVKPAHTQPAETSKHSFVNSPKPLQKADEVNNVDEKRKREPIRISFNKPLIPKKSVDIPNSLDKPPLSESDLQDLLSCESNSPKEPRIAEDMDLEKLEEIRNKIYKELGQSNSTEKKDKAKSPIKSPLSSPTPVSQHAQKSKSSRTERVVKEQVHQFGNILSSIDVQIMEQKKDIKKTDKKESTKKEGESRKDETRKSETKDKDSSSKHDSKKDSKHKDTSRSKDSKSSDHKSKDKSKPKDSKDSSLKTKELSREDPKQNKDVAKVYDKSKNHSKSDVKSSSKKSDSDNKHPTKEIKESATKESLYKDSSSRDSSSKDSTSRDSSNKDQTQKNSTGKDLTCKESTKDSSYKKDETSKQKDIKSTEKRHEFLTKVTTSKSVENKETIKSPIRDENKSKTDRTSKEISSRNEDRLDRAEIEKPKRDDPRLANSGRLSDKYPHKRKPSIETRAETITKPTEIPLVGESPSNLSVNEMPIKLTDPRLRNAKSPPPPGFFSRRQSCHERVPPFSNNDPNKLFSRRQSCTDSDAAFAQNDFNAFLNEQQMVQYPFMKDQSPAFSSNSPMFNRPMHFNGENVEKFNNNGFLGPMFTGQSEVGNLNPEFQRPMPFSDINNRSGPFPNDKSLLDNIPNVDLFPPGNRTPADFQAGSRTPGDPFQAGSRTPGDPFQCGSRTPSDHFQSGNRTPADLFQSGSRTPGDPFQTGSRTPGDTFQSASMTPADPFQSGSRTPGDSFQSGNRTPSNTFLLPAPTQNFEQFPGINRPNLNNSFQNQFNTNTSPKQFTQPLLPLPATSPNQFWNRNNQGTTDQFPMKHNQFERPQNPYAKQAKNFPNFQPNQQQNQMGQPRFANHKSNLRYSNMLSPRDKNFDHSNQYDLSQMNPVDFYEHSQQETTKSDKHEKRIPSLLEISCDYNNRSSRGRGSPRGNFRGRGSYTSRYSLCRYPGDEQKSDRKYQEYSEKGTSDKNSKESDKHDEVFSPLNSLYSKESKKVGKGYGIQKFKIPKKKRSSIEELKDDNKRKEVTVKKEDTEKKVEAKVEEDKQNEIVVEKQLEISETENVETIDKEEEIVKQEKSEETDKSNKVEKSEKTEQVTGEVNPDEKMDMFNCFMKQVVGSCDASVFMQFLEKMGVQLPTKKTKKYRRVIDTDSDDSEDEQKEEISKPVEEIEERKTPEKEVDKPAEQINKEELVVESVGERIKNRKRQVKSSPNKLNSSNSSAKDTDDDVKKKDDEKKKLPKPKRRNALELLQDDLREMFICEGVLTATGQRMCRIMKEHQDSVLKSSANMQGKNSDDDFDEDDNIPLNRRKFTLRSEKGKSSKCDTLTDISGTKLRSSPRVVLEVTDVSKFTHPESDQPEDEVEESKKPVRQTRRTEFLLSTSTPKLASKRQANKTSGPKGRKRRRLDSSTESIADFEDDVSSIASSSIKEKSELEDSVDEDTKSEKSPEKKQVRKKTKRNNWALGVIKKKNTKPKSSSSTTVEMSDDLSHIDEIPAETEANVVEKDVSDAEEYSLLSIDPTPDVNYYLCNLKKYDCKLCSYSGKFVVHHYRTKHRESENMISRLSPQQAESARTESLTTGLTEIEPFEEIIDGKKRRTTFWCRFCSLIIKYDASNNFFDHLCSHTGEYRFSCSQCSFYTALKKTLSAHYHNAHPNMKKSYSITPTYEPPPNFRIVFGFMCLACNYIQLLKTNTEKHIKVSHPDQNVEILKVNLSSRPVFINDLLPNYVKPDIEVKPEATESEKDEEVTFEIIVDENAEDIIQISSSEKQIEQTKETDMTVFMVPEDVTEREKLIEDERIKKMQEVISHISPRRSVLQFVDKLKNKLDNALITPTVEEPIETTVTKDTGNKWIEIVNTCSLASEESILQEIPKTPEKQVAVTEPDIVENPIEIILEHEDTESLGDEPIDVCSVELDLPTDSKQKGVMNTIQRLAAQLQTPSAVNSDAKSADQSIDRQSVDQLSNDKESLDSQLINIESLECIMSESYDSNLTKTSEIFKDGSTKDNVINVGAIEVKQSGKETLYSCLVPGCHFCSDYKIEFTQHCSTGHPNFKFVCKICSQVHAIGKEFNLLSLFVHLIDKHKDHQTPEPTSEKKSEPARIRIRRISGDVLSNFKPDNDTVSSKGPIEQPIHPPDSLASFFQISNVRTLTPEEENKLATEPKTKTQPSILQISPQNYQIIYTNSKVLFPIANAPKIAKVTKITTKDPTEKTAQVVTKPQKLETVTSFQKIPVIPANQSIISPTSGLITTTQSIINSTQSLTTNQTVLTSNQPIKTSNQPIKTPIQSVAPSKQPITSTQSVASPRPSTAIVSQSNTVLKKREDVLQRMLDNSQIADLYKCPFPKCDFSTNKRISFILHIKKHCPFASGQYCVYCNNSVRVANLSNHIEMRHGHCLFQCAYCFYRGFSRAYLAFHQQNCHEGVRNFIQLKPYKYIRDGQYPENLLPKAHAILSYLCYQGKCNCSITLLMDFMAHLRSVHKQPYICAMCMVLNQFTTAQSLIKHYLKHGIGMYQCRYCLYGAETPMILLEHYSKVHTSHTPIAYVRQYKTNTVSPLLTDDERLSEIEEVDLELLTANLLNILPESVTTLTPRQTPNVQAILNIEDITVTNEGYLEPLVTLKHRTAESKNAVVTAIDPLLLDSEPEYPPTAENLDQVIQIQNTPVPSPPIAPEKTTKTTPTQETITLYSSHMQNTNSVIIQNPTLLQPVKLKTTTIGGVHDDVFDMIEFNKDSLSRTYKPPRLNKASTIAETSTTSIETIDLNIDDDDEPVEGTKSDDKSSEKEEQNNETSKSTEKSNNDTDKPIETLKINVETPQIEEPTEIVDVETPQIEEPTEIVDVETPQIEEPTEIVDLEIEEIPESQPINKKVTSPDENNISVIDFTQINNLTGRDLFRCGTYNCGFSATNEQEFRVHIFRCDVSAMAGNWYICIHCQQCYKFAGGLADHIKIHGAKRYSCSMCRVKMYKSHMIEKHMRIKHKVHSAKLEPVVPYKTDKECDFFVAMPPNSRSKTESGSILEAIVSISEDRTVFGPDEIDQLPRRPVYMQEVKCKLCLYSTKVRSNILRHLQAHIDEKAVPETAPVNPVPCLEKNEKMFDKMTNLAASSHTGRISGRMSDKTAAVTKEEELAKPEFIPANKRFVCGAEGCNYLTHNEAMLKHHFTALHLDEISYKCPHCNSQLHTEAEGLTIDNIIKHLKMHDLNLYKCTHCSYMHYQKSKIDKHLSDKHPDRIPYITVVRELELSANAGEENKTESTDAKEFKPWRCGLCSFQTQSRTNVQKHAANIHGIKSQFKCGMCHFRCSAKNNYSNHFRTKHPKNDIKIISVYYKIAEQVEPVIPESIPELETFDTTPLWSRDKPRIRHIRGILLDETSKKIKKSTPKSPEKNATDKNLVEKEKNSTEKHTPVIRSTGLQKTATEKGVTQKTAVLSQKLGQDLSDLEQEKALVPNSSPEKIAQNKSILKKSSFKKILPRPDKEKVLEQIQITLPDKSVPEIIMCMPDNSVCVPETILTVPEKIQPQISSPETLPQTDKILLDVSCTETFIIDDSSNEGTDVGNSEYVKTVLEELSAEVNSKLLEKYGSPDKDVYVCPFCDKYRNKSVKEFIQHLSIEMDYYRCICNYCGFKSVNPTQAKHHHATDHAKVDQSLTPIAPNSKIESWIDKCVQYQQTEMKKIKTENLENASTVSLDSDNFIVETDSLSGDKSVPNLEELSEQYNILEFGKHFLGYDEETAVASTSTPAITKKQNLLECEHCQFIAKTQQTLKKHIKRHFMHKPYRCTYCKFTAFEDVTIKLHVSSKHPNCDMIFDVIPTPMEPTFRPLKRKGAAFSEEPPNTVKITKRRVSKQQLQVEEKGEIYVCYHCPKRSDKLDVIKAHILDSHEKTHRNVYKYKKLTIDKSRKATYNCKYCHWSGLPDGLKQHHMEEHNDQDFVVEKSAKYQCGICNETYKNAPNLKKHFLIFHPNDPLTYKTVIDGEACVVDKVTVMEEPIIKLETERHQCDNCLDNFDTVNDLLIHHKDSHPNLELRIDQPDTELKKFKCPICDHSSNSYPAMRDHIRSHSKPFKCMYCPLTGSYPSIIKTHHVKEHRNLKYEYEINPQAQKLIEEHREQLLILCPDGIYRPKSMVSKRRLSDAEEQPNKIIILESRPSTSMEMKIVRKSVARKSTASHPTKKFNFAKKSTSRPARSIDEGFSFYGTKPRDVEEYKNVISEINIMGKSRTINVLAMSHVLNLFPTVLVEDFNKKQPI